MSGGALVARRRLALALATLVALGSGGCDRYADPRSIGPGVRSAVVEAASGGAAGGHDPASPPGGGGVAAAAGPSQLSDADQSFIAAAATRGQFEMQASQLAAARAASSEVKAFAALLINDHTHAGNELAQLAAARGLALPARLSPDLQERLRRLARGSGPGFDREYVERVGVGDQLKEIRSFEEASGSTRDRPLKDWIDRTLPALRQHLSEAEKLSRRG